MDGCATLRTIFHMRCNENVNTIASIHVFECSNVASFIAGINEKEMKKGGWSKAAANQDLHDPV